LLQKNDSYRAYSGILGIHEIKEAKELVRAVREYARQGLQEGCGHDHTKPKIHYEGWSHHGILKIFTNFLF
jgi:hypothetical protein